MPVKEWFEVIDTDLARHVPITEKTRELAKEEAFRFRGSVRVSTGRFSTDAEYEERKQRVMSTPLP